MATSTRQRKGGSKQSEANRLGNLGPGRIRKNMVKQNPGRTKDYEKGKSDSSEQRKERDKSTKGPKKARGFNSLENGLKWQRKKEKTTAGKCTTS